MFKKIWRKTVRRINFIKEQFEHKYFPKCQECGAKLNKKNEYHMKYGFCDVNCGYKLYGLSPWDFY